MSCNPCRCGEPWMPSKEAMERFRRYINASVQPMDDDDIANAMHEAFLVDYPKVRDFILRGGWPSEEELRRPTPDTPQRVAMVREADRVYARHRETK